MMRILTLTCAVLAFTALPALAADVHTGDSKKAEFHIAQPLVVGETTLKAGDYKFQCKMINGEHFLVVTSSEDGTEVAKVPCQPEELKTKIDMSDFRSISRPDGTKALTSVRIKGETIAHRVAS